MQPARTLSDCRVVLRAGSSRTAHSSSVRLPILISRNVRRCRPPSRSSSKRQAAGAPVTDEEEVDSDSTACSGAPEPSQARAHEPAASKSPTFHFDTLPDELLDGTIADALGLQDLCAFAQVCKKFRTIAVRPANCHALPPLSLPCWCIQESVNMACTYRFDPLFTPPPPPSLTNRGPCL